MAVPSPHQLFNLFPTYLIYQFTEEMEASWESLPPRLLEMILERLPISDYLRFAGVCPNWCFVQRNHRLRIASSPRQMPWLMFPEALQSPKRLFYSPTDQRYYHLPLPEPHGLKRHYCGSSHGWLLFVDVTVVNDFIARNKTRIRYRIRLTLVNPFTGSEIRIPVPACLFPSVCKPVVVLSTIPTDPNCIVLISDHCGQFFCRMRDKWWSRASSFMTCCEPAAICGGKFYIDGGYADSDGSMLIVVDPVPVATVSCMFMEGLPRSESVLERKFLLESDGKLLLTRLIFDEGMDTERIEVFEADFTENMWVKLENLGDRVLFLSGRHAFSMPVAETGGPGNHIYLTSKLSFFDEGKYLGPLWIEYDYGSHQAVTSSELLRSCQHGGQESFEGEFLNWVVPSLLQCASS